MSSHVFMTSSMTAAARGFQGAVFCLALLGFSIAAPLSPEVEVQDFFKWSLQPQQARPVNQHVWTSACAFVARCVQKIPREIGQKVKMGVPVKEASAAMDMCGRRKWNEVQVRQPVDILKAFLDVLVKENLITSKDVIEYTGYNPEPIWLSVAGPSAAGKGTSLPNLMTAALNDDKRLRDLPIFINLDNDLLGGTIVREEFKGIANKEKDELDRVVLFLFSCGVSFSSTFRDFNIDEMTLHPASQRLVDDIYGPPKPYRTMLMLVLASEQSATCNMYVRRGLNGKKVYPNQWIETLQGLTTILGGFPNLLQPSVYVWFDEIAGICNEAPTLSAPAEIVDPETPALASIAEFCEKNAHMLQLSGHTMKRHYVNSGTPVHMAPKDLIDILQNGENGEEYLSRLRNKLSALHMSDAELFLFPEAVCPVQGHTIMNFQSSDSKTTPVLVPPGPQWQYHSIFSGLLIVASAAALAVVAHWKTLVLWMTSSKTPTKDDSYFKLVDDEIM